jgi:outer membrane protein
MSKYIFIAVFVTTILAPSQAQYFDEPIKKSWAKDKHLQAQDFQLKIATLSLEEAKAMYGPSAGFGIQYSLAAGGRSIDFPVGDLLNPVYSTLNTVTNSQSFPQIENVSTNFLPNNFYDAKVSVLQPIYYPDLAINKALKQEQITMKALEIKAYKRMLSKEVMNAIINVSMAEEAKKIYNETEKLLDEAKRSTRSMLTNGIALPSSLSRIETQMASIQALQIEAENTKKNALLYLDFLVGDTVSAESSSIFENLPTIEIRANQKEELAQLDQGRKMLVLAEKREDKFYSPKLGAKLDLGSQAFNFGFTPYALLGLNLEVNLFDNKRHKIRKEINNAAVSEHQAKSSQILDQLNLQSMVSQNNLQSAIDQANTYKPRIEAVKKIYKEVFTKYKEGSTNYIELLDAQTQITQTALQYNLAKYNTWMKWAAHVYNTASYKID